MGMSQGEAAELREMGAKFETLAKRNQELMDEVVAVRAELDGIRQSVEALRASVLAVAPAYQDPIKIPPKPKLLQQYEKEHARRVAARGDTGKAIEGEAADVAELEEAEADDAQAEGDVA